MYVTKAIKKFTHNTKGQGGIVGFFIGAMIAVIIALQVTWPVIDDVLNGSGATSMANMSGAAQSLVELIPLFLILTLVMVFVRPLM